MTATRTETIPAFRLPASTGQTLEREAFTGKVPLVISFLAGFDHAETESLVKAFNARLSDFGAHRAQVLVVVPETAAEARDFAAQHGIRFPILADPAMEMARAFDAVGDDQTAPTPVLVVTDRDGVVVRRFDDVPREGQVDAALTAIRAEGSNWLDPTSG